MRALVVEDDASIAEFVVRGLREAGFAVDQATDGEEGLAAAARQPYDVAIVDVMLPSAMDCRSSRSCGAAGSPRRS